jgi:hypothetical protein
MIERPLGRVSAAAALCAALCAASPAASAQTPHASRSERILGTSLAALVPGLRVIAMPPSTTVTALAGLVAIPAFVYCAGQESDGNGGYGWTTLGALAGELAALGVAAAIDPGEAQDWTLRVGALLLPAAGAVLGYELSSDADARVSSRASVRFAPTVHASREGALVGLAGTF